MHKIHAEFAYVKGETDVGTSLLEVLTSRRGVCQDYAHFMIACLRALGLSARYVSGYLHTRSSNTGEQVQGAEASHAWIAVFVPPLGWVELDPTNRLVVNQDHVVLAWGRDFGDVSPLRGVILGGGAHSLEVGVAVQALQS
jgi:transglutaminase-like putative cysteine protease